MKKKVLLVFMLYSLIPILALNAEGSRTMCENYICGKHFDFEIESFKDGTLVLNVWSYVENANMKINSITIHGKTWSFTTSPIHGKLGFGEPLKITIKGYGYVRAPGKSSIVMSATRCEVIRN